jgi:ribonuclease HI
MTYSKLDYGSFLFATACPSLLIILDRIQFAAARIILGCLRSTKVNCLEAEADLMPLTIRRRLSMSSYASRVLTVPSHPFRQQILDYYPYEYYRRQRETLPISGRIYEEFSKLNVAYDVIPIVDTSHRYSTIILPACTTMHINKKESLSPKHWQSLFQDLLAQYDGYTAVYCDGSQQGSKTGSGVWSETFSLMARLPSHTSIYTAELYALYSAMEFTTNHSGKFLFLSDSYSSVVAVRRPYTSKHYMVHKIAALMQSHGRRDVVVEWVPGHMSITGNDRADELAKQSLLLPNVTNINIPSYELTTKLKTFYRTTWQSRWTLSGTQLLAIKPELGLSPHFQRPRREQICITRLRLGTTKLTHGHYFRKMPRMSCQVCHTDWTLQHLLIDCQHLSNHRLSLKLSCALLKKPCTVTTLLSDKFPSDKLIEFLHKTGFLTEI